jgi:hypothetical protein
MVWRVELRDSLEDKSMPDLMPPPHPRWGGLRRTADADYVSHKFLDVGLPRCHREDNGGPMKGLLTVAPTATCLQLAVYLEKLSDPLIKQTVEA